MNFGNYNNNNRAQNGYGSTEPNNTNKAFHAEEELGDDATFEQMMSRLETIVAALERGNSMSLEESLKAYDEGVRLSQRCAKMLEQAEQRVLKVSKGQNDEPVFTDVTT